MMAKTIALAGNPNCGKTTLFNALTGARQHVSNYPGVTVERKEGTYMVDGQVMHIVDLPGTYSLTAYSLEEVVARDFIINEKPAVVIDIVDASNLERNLYLAVQFLEMGVPLCIALNMVDMAQRRGIDIDSNKLSELLGVPVIPTIARNGKGKAELMQAAVRVAQNTDRTDMLKISYGNDIDPALMQMEQRIEAAGFLADRYRPRWTALKYLENDDNIMMLGRQANPELAAELEAMVQKVARHIKNTFDSYPEAVIADQRYGYIRSIVNQGVITRAQDPGKQHLSDHMDRILTHRVVGPMIMAAVLFGLYQFTFAYSETPVAWMESLFGWLGGVVDDALSEGLLKSLIISGMIDGVGGVLGFVPLIMFMFFGIAILEDSGYLARVAFMLDRVFRVFGLHGSSVMPFIISGGIAGGCAVPGIMATRTLKSPRERLATLLTVPFMNCGAKLPVFALLVGTFFAGHKALVMFAITLIAWAGALLVARLLRSTVIKGEATPFVMELPPYRLPTLKGVAIHTWERTWQYIKKAGTVILGISIILWAMMTFPGLPHKTQQAYENQRQALRAAAPASLPAELSAVDAAEAEAGLRYSIAGRIGTALESVSRWAGFDWRTNIALVGGFAAKEVVVSTLGTAYSLGEVDPEATGSLSQTLAASPGWRPLTAFALILFLMFYAPCFVSVVCIARESGSWKWGAFSMVFNTTLAFAIAVLVYQVGTALGW
jgi:ferrous iron transport protein B